MITFVVLALALAAPIPVETIKDAVPPTIAARSLTASKVPSLTPQAVTVRFQCAIEEGRLTYCAKVDAEPYRDFMALIKASGASQTGTPVGVAQQRLAYWNFPNSPLECSNMIDCPTVVVTERVSSNDVATIEQQGTTEAKNLVFVQATAAGVSLFYPPGAMRSGVTASVKATSRIMKDGSLLCRNPQTEGTTQSPIDFNDQFARSTVQALAAIRVELRSRDGKPVIGYEFDTKLGWRLPQ